MIVVVFSVLAIAGASAKPEARPVGIKVTHGHLRPVCVDGEPTKSGEKSWQLPPGPHSMVFTMRNQPRQGVPQSPPGFAAVTFTLEAGHKYEVEVRAPATAFSTRVWARGEWKPVVRDRTVDRIVSSEPDWRESEACETGGTR